MLIRLKVLHKIILLSLVLLVFIIGVGFTGFYFTREANSEMTALYSENLMPIEWLSGLLDSVSKNEANLISIIKYNGDTFRQQKFMDDITVQNKTIENNWKLYLEKKHDSLESERIPNVEKYLATFKLLTENVSKLAMEGNTADADSLLSGDSANVQQLKKALGDLVIYKEQVADGIKIRNDADYLKSIEIMAAVILLALVFGIIFSLLTIRGIVIPISTLRKELNRLVERGGDLTKEINIASKDEIGDLAKSVNKFIGNLRVIMQEVNRCSEGVEVASAAVSEHLRELDENVEDTSSTVEELSAGMEETAASTEEMNATSSEIEKAVDSIAAKAEEGASAAGGISRKAAELRESFLNSQKSTVEVFTTVKEKLENALAESQSIKQINELAEAILNITSQTNLLALNAAIEAARAGEAGKGFSVVAEEIRRLAETSKATVTQIQHISKTVVGSVENLSASSNKLLEFMDTDVRRDYDSMLKATEEYEKDAGLIDNLVSDFSATAEEVAASMQNMIKAIGEITSAANEGAAGTQNIAEKTAGIVKKVGDVQQQMEISSDYARRLKASVEKFKV